MVRHMEERRREARTVELLEIREINRQPVNGSYLLDHSPLGAKLESSLSFAPGDGVEFSYLRPGEAQETCRWGQVIWVIPAPDKPGRYLMGVEFVLLD
ncbi:MAG: PilZ domain-containing protein [Deltaproteobacteria bacterium]|nr:PilZ domain-containing protein [Deltaproteobacteria bacterium]MBI4794341.1 PilZ domain-containing protein [Deltaproteobacteria bacterium]